MSKSESASHSDGQTGPTPGMDDARARILEAMLPLVPFDGWNVPILRRAARDAGLDRAVQRVAFPGGVIDVIDLFLERGDRLMLDRLADEDLESLKIRQRITLAVRTRLEVVEPHKDAVRQAVNFLAMPLHAPSATRFLARTVDHMWRAAGDRSTDFNYYTKRTILGGVYSSTLLVWIGDQSADHEDTWSFLDRRIQNVMEFEKFKAKAQSAFSGMPSPLAVLSSLRYSGRGR